MPEIEIPEIREIAPPLPPDGSWPFYIWAAIALASILLIALATFLLLRRHPTTTPAQDSNDDPRQSALAKLGALAEAHTGLPANAFALQASSGLRVYLTAFYGSTTPFETGREFLDRQGQHGLMDELKFSTITDLFQRAETLKYAPAPGADGQRLQLVQDMIAFVRDDIPGPKLSAASNRKSDHDSDADPFPA